MSKKIELRALSFSRRRLLEWAFGLFLFLTVVFAYQPAWHAGFIWDDDDYVTNNLLLTAPDGLRRIWLSTDSPSQYFPLTYTIFRIEHNLWGFNSAGYHWANILLHAVNSLLVWRLLLRLSIRGAWLAAAIFALHPVQVESVAWVSECKNLLMCLFFLLSLLGWIEFVEEQTNRRWRFYFAALICFALALFSKTTACTLPAALLLILWLKKNPINWPRLLQTFPFFVMGICMGLLTVWWERNHIGTHGNMFSLDLLERIIVASRAIWFYAGKLLWPVNLTFSYPKWPIHPNDPLAYRWLVALGGVCVAIYLLRRFVGRSFETAALFYAATLCPMLGFIMLYTFRYTYVADHYQYVASIGPIALVSAGTSIAFRNRTFIRLAICGALLLTLGTATWRQSGTYTDAETLWQTTISRNPDSWLAYGNLGNDLLKRGKVNEAIECNQKALKINPDYSEAHNNLGVALFQKGRVDDAIEQYQKALKIQPDDWDVCYNLGNAFFQKRNMPEAISCFQKALEIQPASPNVYCHLGNAFFEERQLDKAISCYRIALEINPNYAEAHNNIGSAFLQQKNLDEAIAHFQRALKIDPGLASTHNNLGTAFLQDGRLNEATAQFQDALAIQPDFALARTNLDKVLQKKRN